MEKDNLQYIEDTLKEMIEETKNDLRSIGDLANEMDGDPKIVALKIEMTGKAANILDKLMSLERMKINKGKNTPTGFSLEGAIFAKSSELLSQIEETKYGINTRSTLYLEQAEDAEVIEVIKEE